MEPEEDDEWHAQVTDDAPRQVAVERGVYRQVLDLLHLEYADDPQRQVAEDEEGDQRPAGLGPGVGQRVRRPVQGVQYEDGLSGRLVPKQTKTNKQKYLFIYMN